MKDVLIALIHNKHEERLENARSVVMGLAEALSGSCRVKTVEISEQPPVKPVSVSGMIYRDIQFRNLCRRWEKYRKLKPTFYVIYWISWIVDAIQKYLFNHSYAEKRRTQLYIDKVITAKHIRAWELFVESGNDLLVVFEDDILFSMDYPAIHHLLTQQIFVDMVGDASLYVDLAGGFSFNQLHVQKLEMQYENGIRHFCKPVTNTACGYIINTPLARYFLKLLDKHPSVKYLTIDFLMNNLFIELGQDGINCRCMHFDPPLFEHGSFKGVYKQWR